MKQRSSIYFYLQRDAGCCKTSERIYEGCCRVWL